MDGDRSSKGARVLDMRALSRVTVSGSPPIRPAAAGRAPTRAIIVDTREKDPFLFKGHRTRKEGLRTGDYSVAGLEATIAVERKSGADLVNTLLVNCDRFERELERAATMAVFSVVVECSMAGLLLTMQGRTSVPLRTVLARAAVLSSRHRVPFLFCDNRSMAEAITLEILRPHL